MSIIINNKCCLCDETLNEKILLKFPKTPLANNFSLNGQLVELFPLDLTSCPYCTHVQLQKKIDPNIIFKNYLYKSGVSQSFINHFKQYVTKIDDNSNFNKLSKVLEIGANDGTLINAFNEMGYKNLYAIEPAINLKPIKLKNNLTWISEFFDFKFSQKFLKEYGQMDIICANNVLAHSPNLHEIFQGISEILNIDGILTFEVSYLLDLLQKSYFDMVYHEHYSYHHLTPLFKILPKFGLNLIDVEKIDTHGGSIRCYVSKKQIKPSLNLVSMLKTESYFFNDLEGQFKLMEEKILKNSTNLLNKINKSVKTHPNVIGFGAPAKLTTLFYKFDLFQLNIKCIIDDNELKIGKFTPGTNIPIKAYKDIQDFIPATIIIFAWNFFDIISVRLRNDFGKNLIIINPMEN